MEYMENLTEYVEKQASLCQQHDVIDKELYARYGVKRGLRDENGQGVLTGLTNISQIIAFKDVDGQKVPCSDGKKHPVALCGYPICVPQHRACASVCL